MRQTVVGAIRSVHTLSEHSLRNGPSETIEYTNSYHANTQLPVLQAAPKPLVATVVGPVGARRTYHDHSPSTRRRRPQTAPQVRAPATPCPSLDGLFPPHLGPRGPAVVSEPRQQLNPGLTLRTMGMDGCGARQRKGGLSARPVREHSWSKSSSPSICTSPTSPSIKKGDRFTGSVGLLATSLVLTLH